MHNFVPLKVICNVARMAELVDALVSGASVSNDVQVRFLFRARLEALMT